MFGEHYGQPPAWLWFSFQAMVVLLSHRELRSRPTGLFYVHSLKLNPQPPPGLPSQGFLLPPPAIVLGLITVPGLNSEPKKGSALTQTLPPQFPAPTLATLPHGLSPHPSNVSSWLTWEPFSLKFWGSLAPSPLPLEF